MNIKGFLTIVLSRLLQGLGVDMFIAGLLLGSWFTFFTHLSFRVWLILFFLLMMVLGLCIFGFAMKRI